MRTRRACATRDHRAVQHAPPQALKDTAAMRQSPLPPQSEHRALAIAQAVYEAFEDYHARFSEITACAKQRFETRD
ncbi:isocitrate dehydrogenase kinase-phosphatase [Xanthomonas oryzae pv. oryzicola BLS256]|uniref:Isocitrate dehydrogenase kinase-phosphatase n=1 Tax=Xanthomonas oryzae pv. oryzicola (strain BLS256) TaxID=383407 RepID=G7TAN7_XANOB|nr:isocitrate dehydrogenase kinase-phosphatase [Xanthomonas oryzae pv. oryzicola BLS256]